MWCIAKANISMAEDKEKKEDTWEMIHNICTTMIHHLNNILQYNRTIHISTRLLIAKTLSFWGGGWTIYEHKKCVCFMRWMSYSSLGKPWWGSRPHWASWWGSQQIWIWDFPSQHVPLLPDSISNSFWYPDIWRNNPNTTRGQPFANESWFMRAENQTEFKQIACPCKKGYLIQMPTYWEGEG